MNCDQALKILLDPNHTERDAEINYIKTDPDCLARVDQLERAIVSDIEQETSCAETRLHFADYFEWQKNHEIEPENITDITQHLDRCSYCQLEYQQLVETMAAFEAGTLPKIESMPKFNLNFITQETWPVIDSIRTLFKQIEVTISTGVASMVALSPQLVPQVVPVGLRGPDDPEYAVLVLPDEEAKIHFQVESKPLPDGTALIELGVFDSELDTSISDVRVTLHNADGARIASFLTDQSGTVKFSHIAPERYVIQANHDGKKWELPITIKAI